jgi:hypothetical protein
MLFALLVLLSSNADALKDAFVIDTYAEYHDGTWTNRIPHSGTSCQLCVKHGQSGTTVCETGPRDGNPDWMVRFSYASLQRDTWIWTSCSDAVIIDRATLYDDDANDRQWGMDEGNMWCLSEDVHDYWGWPGYRGMMTCFRLLLFAADGHAYYYHDFWWTPDGRRAMEDTSEENVPTADDFNQCEADESKTHEECVDFVDQIFKNAISHPERRERTATVARVENSDDDGTLWAMANRASTSADFSWAAIYGFAGIGFAFVMLQGAKIVKRLTQKEVFTPIKSQDEL